MSFNFISQDIIVTNSYTSIATMPTATAKIAAAASSFAAGEAA